MTKNIISDLIVRLNTYNIKNNIIHTINSSQLNNKNELRFIMENCIELVEILILLQSLGILTYKIFNKTIIIYTHFNAFSDIILHSKPSRRIYKSYRDLWTNNAGKGKAILRTSKGLKTIDQARKERIGGELLFTII